ncbi:MAG: shikimate dehydrogenase [Sphingomonadaceae bacterium]|nr:shikimate dehydrogenase [Sphingomonadaceae bacterium]MCP5384893.1 shikimate dehydrogenase [Altererythrobacter sp.]MCP5390511.1 shikimate dehydrogenase [Sphingomonadaceae bacterium]MCP5392706.1 shikimate dehydrogenase [Sphingomonadaceae bacterium]
MSPEERLEILPYAEVIGDPIEQSKSPAIHNFWLGRLGLDAVYQRQLVTSDGLTEYLAARRQDPRWRGCNVTMPHKQAIIPLLDRVDPLAARIGAVNTVVRDEDGMLAGYNTDCAGFLEPLGSDLAQTHLFRMARILGTGGAARAIVAGLADNGFTLVLAGRNPDKARSMLDELAPEGEHHAISLDHFAERTDFAFDDRAGILDLVVNASPLGMHGQPELAFDWSHAPPGSIAYDIVTHPVETRLLSIASRAGSRTIDGLSMLIGQAAIAFELFFGAKPPRDCDGELRARLSA